MAPIAVSSSLPSSPAQIKAALRSSIEQPAHTRSETAMSDFKRPVEVQNPSVRSNFAFDSMDDALAAFRRGEFLVVMDDENRENEGDLIIAASLCTTEKMAWMIKHTRLVKSD